MSASVKAALLELADDLDAYSWAENLGYPARVAEKLRALAEELDES